MKAGRRECSEEKSLPRSAPPPFLCGGALRTDADGDALEREPLPQVSGDFAVHFLDGGLVSLPRAERRQHFDPVQLVQVPPADLVEVVCRDGKFFLYDILFLAVGPDDLGLPGL